MSVWVWVSKLVSYFPSLLLFPSTSDERSFPFFFICQNADFDFNPRSFSVPLRNIGDDGFIVVINNCSHWGFRRDFVSFLFSSDLDVVWTETVETKIVGVWRHSTSSKSQRPSFPIRKEAWHWVHHWNFQYRFKRCREICLRRGNLSWNRSQRCKVKDIFILVCALQIMFLGRGPEGDEIL